MTMLRVEKLTCGYGREPVVKGLTFSVEEGQRLCILGPNGCGKTTLLRAVAGLLPCEGTVEVCGRALSAMSRRETAQNIALMSQLTGTYFSYTVYETVMLGRYAHHKGGGLERESAEDRRIVRESLERTGTLALSDRLITELSGGQLQRVFLARAFAQDPAVILLDEPTNHLDLRYQVELTETLKTWAAQGGRAVLGVLHDINLALSFADTVLLMEDGRACFYGPAAALEPALLSRVYGMDVDGYMRRTLSRWA